MREATGLNGKHGRAYEARGDRIVVYFERGLGLKALRTDNLRLVLSPPSPPEDEEAAYELGHSRLRTPAPIQPWQPGRCQQDEVDAHQ